MKKYNFSHLKSILDKSRGIFLLLWLFFAAAMLFSQEAGTPAAEATQSSQEQGISLTGDQSKMPIGGGQESVPNEAGNNQEPQLSVPGLSAWNFILMFVVLAIIIAAVWGLSKLLKRLAGNNFAGSEIMKLDGSLSLSGNRFLHLVEVGNQLFLVGASDNSVELVAEITDQETIDQIRLRQSSQQAAQGGSFLQRLLSKMQKGQSAPKQNTDLQGQTLEFMNKQKERLKNL